MAQTSYYHPLKSIVARATNDNQGQTMIHLKKYWDY